MHTDFPTAPDGAQRPTGLNHVVLNVRDIEESHRFWTDILGFRQVGASRPDKDGSPHPQMRFYSGDHDGRKVAEMHRVTPLEQLKIDN